MKKLATYTAACLLLVGCGQTHFLPHHLKEALTLCDGRAGMKFITLSASMSTVFADAYCNDGTRVEKEYVK